MKGRLHTVLFAAYVVLNSFISRPSFADVPPPGDGGEPIPGPVIIRATANGVGTKGKGSADNLLFTGSFLYNIPLEAPPGIAGIQPDISLHYNSSAPNGWVGVGWDLSLGTIQRSTKNGTPSYLNIDTFTFTLNGQTEELVRLNDGSYRAKIESGFQKFTFQENKWIVYDKSGMRYFFGQTDASRLNSGSSGGPVAPQVGPSPSPTPMPTPSPSPSDGQAFLWALDKVVDRNGNTMTFSYTKFDTDKQIYPIEILYTGNTTTGRSMDRKVTFGLQDREDILTSYRSGFSIKTAKRLSYIKTAVLLSRGWTLVHRYDLSYLSRPDTHRSLLQQVTMTGYDESELQSQSQILAQFEYPTESRGWQERSEWSLPWALTTGADNWIPTQAQFIDLNGDALPDFVYTGPGTDDHAWINTGTGWQEQSQWVPPIDLANGDYVPNGVQFADLNGDGLPDILYGRYGYTPLSWLNTGSGWVQRNEWAVPHYLLTAMGSNPGVRVIDINGDNKADLVAAYKLDNFPGPSFRQTWINTGSGWQESVQWQLPVDLGIKYASTNVQFQDVNGDHLPDLIWAPSNGPHRTWLNTGQGWSEKSVWAIPENLVNINTSGLPTYNIEGVRFADVNGDGLADLVAAMNNGTEYHHTYINTGNGWQEQASWNLPLHANLALGHPGSSTNATFRDLNGDGLLDFSIAYYTGSGNSIRAWLNTGSGWSAEIPEWFAPQALGVQDNHWPGSELVDLNGDQLPDFAISYFNPVPDVFRHTWLSAGTPHEDLIQSITNTIGGKVLIEYEKSTVYPESALPFPMWVVKSITQQGGVDSSSDIRTQYSYRGGLFDVKEKEFLGFRKVEATDADGNLNVTTFHQKKDASGVDVPVNALKGRIQKVEQINSSGQLLTTQETVWEYIIPSSGVYFVRPQSVKSILSDVTPNLITQVDNTYDDTASGGPGYGNVTRVVNQGDVSISGDERIEIMEYAVNLGDYLLSFPKRTATLASDGSVLSETRTFYDSSEDSGVITKGNPTKIQRWLNLPTEKWITTLSEYDAYGRVTAMIDPHGARIETTYDTAGFPIQVRNALGHTVQSDYDLRNGNIKSDTNINNQTTRYTYDLLGRQLKVIGPIDTDDLPSVETDYHTDLIGQPLLQYVETRTRERHGQASVLWTKTYFDGLGRTYKAKQKELSGNSIVTETLFNNRGLTASVSTPRKESPSTPPQWTQSFYDALGRIKEVRRPDQTATTTLYSGRTTYVTDANGKVQSSIVDAYGRIIQRNEPSVPNPTIYEYDTLGNLTGVTDSQGKRSTFQYDSLGRKLSMTDPNAGTWNYAYDDIGNLTHQVDARGVELLFGYDALNRIVYKKLIRDPKGVTYEVIGSSLTTYVYDEFDPDIRPFSKGKLTTVRDRSGTTGFYHDREGAVIKEIKTVNGLSYEVKSSYDAMGRLTQLTYPYDAAIVNYVYDEAGRLEKVTNQDGTKIYCKTPEYDALGRPLKMEKANGLTRVTYSYDPLKQLISNLKLESFRSGTPQTLQDLSYVFDSVGNLTRITDNQNTQKLQTFSYDSLYRLQTANGVYGNQTFSYDALGNFASKDRTAYLYQSSSHPYAVTQTWPSTLPAKDNSTLLAWNLDPAEPIYSMSGTVRDSFGLPRSTVPIVLSGNYDQALNSDSAGSTNAEGKFVFRGLPGGSGASYSLFMSSIGLRSVPAGYAFNPLSRNETDLNFTVTVDTNPLDYTRIRIPRTAIAYGITSPRQLLQGTTNFTGGFIGGLFAQGLVGTQPGFWNNMSGYSPQSEGVDIHAQPVAQYVLPPTATIAGTLGPDFAKGIYQQALSFNGIADLFVFPNSQNVSPTQLTLMMLAKPTATPGYGFATLITKSTGAPLGQLLNGYRLAMDGAGRVVFELGRQGSSVSLTSAQSLTLNKWNFISATYDGAKMKIYIDAQEAGSLSTTVPVLENSLPVSIAASLTAQRHPLQGTFFYGVLDEPRVHNRAWTQAEIYSVKKQYDSIATYSYDDNGNCVTKITPIESWAYRFDSQGRLSQVAMNNVAKATFTYDGDGGRVKKITSDGTTLYIGKLYEERPDSSKIVHIFAGSEMIADMVIPIAGPAQTLYTHSDHLGSVSFVTDETGQPLQSLTYAPFGEIFESSGTSSVHCKYTGQQSDPEINLYYYNARYYDPVLGRFLSADSIVQSAGDPQSLNRYAYVRNSPQLFTDPDGHIFWVPIIVAAAWAGTHGHPLDSDAWQGFDFKSAAIAGAATLAGQGAFSLAQGGFGGAIIAGGAGGTVGGGMSAALNGGNVMQGMGQGFAAGMISGVVAGGIGQAGIFNVNAGAGGVGNVIGSMGGAYASARIMGANGSEADGAVKSSFWESTISNGSQLTYNVIHGPPTKGTYLMGARLREGNSGGIITSIKGIVSSALSVLGIGHSAFLNANTGETVELDAQNHHGLVRRLPATDPDNSFNGSSRRFGAWFQPLDLNINSIPVPANGDRGPYNIFSASCNTYTHHDILGR